MNAPVPLAYRAGRAAWFALIALQLLWHGWLARPERMPLWLVLAITVVPLLLPLAALRDLRRALLWVGILSLFYFCHGVAEAWSLPTVKWLALAEIGLSLLVIVALGAGVKRKPGR
ncbi:MAG TPA: DUF2069 domain-containing protein [Frateuria sp.]|uniref:DUF2069 domain-containing protein n=1 Tax=Frateuria sp. TaxID=2211372 RepID=UPI002DE423AB|nr:DUF2069 domain-containing protein [Frateuria sp.]